MSMPGKRVGVGELLNASEGEGGTTSMPSKKGGGGSMSMPDKVGGGGSTSMPVKEGGESTSMPVDSYRRRLKSVLILCSCDVCRALNSSLVVVVNVM